MLDIGYFRAIQGTTGVLSESDYRVQAAKRSLHKELVSSINYATALRNGVEQNFVITATEVKYKYNIVCMPDDELYPGDMIAYNGEYFIIQQVRNSSPVQNVGIMWQCNLKLRFQNWSSDIIEKWCVFDSGQYSSSKSGDSTIELIDASRKIYMSADDDTEKIFVNKRLAVDTMYDIDGNKVLECYVVSNRSTMTKSYGVNAHLLTLTVESSLFNADRDKYDEMICDYIAPDREDIPADSEKLNVEISGRSSISAGGSRTYTATFYNESGEQVEVPSVWSLSGCNGATFVQNGNKCSVTVRADESYIGDIIVLTCTDAHGDYVMCKKEIEVIG